MSPASFFSLLFLLRNAPTPRGNGGAGDVQFPDAYQYHYPRPYQAQRRAICYVQPNPGSDQAVNGVVEFLQSDQHSDIQINVNLSGFNVVNSGVDSDYQHGFHVHEFGDISGGCGSTGGHFNPDGVNHGGPTDAVRHAGDFGNLRQNADGTLVTSFTDPMATLFDDIDRSIIGKAIVVHAGQDDLGRGGNAGSLANGNAGARLACCVIGFAKNE